MIIIHGKIKHDLGCKQLKRRIIYRTTHIACWVMLIALLLELLAFAVWDMRDFVLLGCTLAAGLIMAAANAFSKACPFCNRPLPVHAFKKPCTCACEFCGKEVNIV